MRVRKRKLPEQIFYDDIYKSIKNLFIEDPNYSSGYYNGNYSDTLQDAAIRKAEFLLEHMERIKHLIIDEDGQE